MKRSSWIALGVFAVLLAAWLAKGMKSAPTAPTPLSIDGYIGAVSDAEMRAQTKDKRPPVEQLTIKTKDGEVQISQLPADPPAAVTPDKAEAPAAEAKWSAKRLYKGRSSEAKATPYRAAAMAEVFARSIRSTFSREIKPGELAEFGLDPAQAIEVQARLSGRNVALRIGKLDKGSDGAEPTTWVQDPARPGVVYQVAGRDLRSPFEVSWSDLRDRSLLTLDLAAVDTLEVHNPADPRAVDFVLRRPALAAGAKRDAGQDWAIASPAGYAVGDVAEWLRSIERLSASEFVDPSDAAERKIATGLDDAKTSAKLVISSGSNKLTLVFGAADASSEAKDVWMRIDGRDELYKVASYSRDQVLARFDQLRDRHVLGSVKAKDAVQLQWRGPDGEFALRRAEGHWQFASGEAASDSAVDSFLGELDGMQVDFAADATPGSAGLDAAEWRLQLSLPSGQSAVLALSKERDGHVLGALQAAGTSGDVFKLQAWNAGKLRKKVSDFADKRLIPLSKDDVTSVEVRPAAGDAYVVERGSTGWVLKQGDRASTIEAERMAEWLAALCALERGSASEKSPAEVGLDKGFDLIRVAAKGGQSVQVAISQQKNGEEVWVSPIRAGKAVAISAIAQASAAVLQKSATALASSQQNAAPPKPAGP